MASELQQKKWANMFNMFDVNGDGKSSKRILTCSTAASMKCAALGLGMRNLMS